MNVYTNDPNTVYDLDRVRASLAGFVSDPEGLADDDVLGLAEWALGARSQQPAPKGVWAWRRMLKPGRRTLDELERLYLR